MYACVIKDMELINNIYGDEIVSINLFGSYPRKLTDAEDIDIVVRLNRALDVNELRKLLQGILSIPIVQVDIECYRNIRTDFGFGYHLLLLESQKAKKEFDDYNNNIVQN